METYGAPGIRCLNRLFNLVIIALSYLCLHFSSLIKAWHNNRICKLMFRPLV